MSAIGLHPFNQHPYLVVLRLYLLLQLTICGPLILQHLVLRLHLYSIRVLLVADFLYFTFDEL